MKFRFLAVVGFAALAFLNSPAFALTTENGPTDSHGAALTDPDEKQNNFDQQVKDGNGHVSQYETSFGTLSIVGSGQYGSAPQGDGTPPTAQTGDQLYQSGRMKSYWH